MFLILINLVCRIRSLHFGESDHHILESGELFHEYIFKFLDEVVAGVFDVVKVDVYGFFGIDVLEDLNGLFEHPDNDVAFGESFNPVYFEVFDVKSDFCN